MYIGTGIFLLVVGAVLKFAVTDQKAGGVDLGTVGVICMLAGAAAIVLSLLIQMPRRRATRTEVLREGPAGDSRTVVDRRDTL